MCLSDALRRSACSPAAQKPYRLAALENIEEQPQRLAMRAFRPGIFLDDFARFVARQVQQRPVRGKISEAKTRQAGLLRAKHLAFAAQAEVFLGYPKSVLRVAHDRDSRLGRLAEWRPVEEQAGGFGAGAPHASAQLMQLGEPEPLGLFDHPH